MGRGHGKVSVELVALMMIVVESVVDVADIAVLEWICAVLVARIFFVVVPTGATQFYGVVRKSARAN